MSTLKEGEDFYFDDEGLMVLTAAYLKKRGHCCESACLNCPYGYSEKVDPNIPRELQNPWDQTELVDDNNNDEDDSF